MDTSILNLPSVSTNDGYVYEVRIEKQCELFQGGPISEAIKNVGEMTIQSEWFAHAQDCQDDLLGLLTSFAHHLRAYTGRKFMIATKINPMHDPSFEGEIDPNEGWEETMVMRMFVADANVLRAENRIQTHIFSTVKAAPFVNLPVDQVNLILQ